LQVGYNATIIPMLVLAALIGAGALAGLAGMFMFHFSTAVYARPLNHHTDILLRR
jgi:ABC-type uncharacterized transport system permease subunit